MDKHLAYRIEQISAESDLFPQVLELRAAAYGREEAGRCEPVDFYSLHFVARSGGTLVAALRVTCRRHGPLESQEFYPGWLLDEFGDRLCAASRMCVRPSWQGNAIPYDLTAFAWRAVLPLGIRIDVSKARIDAIPYYMRMGYFFVTNSIFQFDRWNARCGLIAFPATPARQTRFAQLFDGIDNPCDLSRLPCAASFTLSYRNFVEASENDVCCSTH